MLNLDRRNFLAGSAGLAFLSALPRISLAAGHETLKVAIAGETGDLDLLQNVSTLSSYTVVFDGLIHYGQNGLLEPGLATAWKLADDGKSISFDLREGVKFSDGTPFDAAVAEWNLKRWMGVADFSWIGIADAYESIAIDAPNKITVKLKRPVPAGLLELTIVRPVRFLSPKAVDANGKQTAPIGTGPWIVESYDSAGTVLVRNDNYWGEKPSFSRMELKVVPDELARANGLRSGDLDVIGGDWVAPLSPRRASALKGEGMTVVAEPGTATTILGYSPKSAMMQDKAVALSAPEVQPLPKVLTSREREVLQLAAAGLTNRGIGVKLSISDRTVQGHLASTYAKLQVNSRTEAVTKALQLGLIHLPEQNT